jgi:hypothetical protein
MQLRYLERLVARQFGQDRGQPAGEHRLAGPRRPGEQEVVSARRGDLERAAGLLLTADVGEIRVGSLPPLDRATGYCRQNVSASARSFRRFRASTASNPPPKRAPRRVLTSQITSVAPRATTRSSSPIRHRQFRATTR